MAVICFSPLHCETEALATVYNKHTVQGSRASESSVTGSQGDGINIRHTKRPPSKRDQFPEQHRGPLLGASAYPELPQPVFTARAPSCCFWAGASAIGGVKARPACSPDARRRWLWHGSLKGEPPLTFPEGGFAPAVGAALLGKRCPHPSWCRRPLHGVGGSQAAIPQPLGTTWDDC